MSDHEGADRLDPVHRSKHRIALFRILNLECKELRRDMGASGNRRSAEVIAREVPW